MVNSKIIALAILGIAAAIVGVIIAELGGANQISATGRVDYSDGRTGTFALRVDNGKNYFGLELTNFAGVGDVQADMQDDPMTFQATSSRVLALDSDGEVISCETYDSPIDLDFQQQSSLTSGGSVTIADMTLTIEGINVDNAAAGADNFQHSVSDEACAAADADDYDGRVLTDQRILKVGEEGLERHESRVLNEITGEEESHVQYDVLHIAKINGEMNAKRALQNGDVEYSPGTAAGNSNRYVVTNTMDQMQELTYLSKGIKGCNEVSAAYANVAWRDEYCCRAEGWSLAKWYENNYNAFMICIKNQGSAQKSAVVFRGSNNLQNWQENSMFPPVPWQPRASGTDVVRLEGGDLLHGVVISEPESAEVGFGGKFIMETGRTTEKGFVGKDDSEYNINGGGLGLVEGPNADVWYLNDDGMTLDAVRYEEAADKINIWNIMHDQDASNLGFDDFKPDLSTEIRGDIMDVSGNVGTTYGAHYGFLRQFNRMAPELSTLNAYLGVLPSTYTRYVSGVSLACGMASMAVANGLFTDKLRTFQCPRSWAYQTGDPDGALITEYNVPDPPAKSEDHIGWRHPKDPVSNLPFHDWLYPTGYVHKYRHVTGRSWRVTGDPWRKKKAKRNIQQENYCKSGLGESNMPTNTALSNAPLDLVLFMAPIGRYHGAKKNLQNIMKDLYGSGQTYAAETAVCSPNSGSSDNGL